MKFSLLVLCSLASFVLHSQEDIPFMPADQFESKIDLTFKKRESSDPSIYTFSDGSQPKKTTDAPIAFLAINFVLLRSEGEVKVNVINGRYNRASKVKVGAPVKLAVGFIEDVKNNGEDVEINLIFSNDLKKPIRKVTFKIGQDGSYFVNGEKRGKF
jgi:hypothetical protein